MIFDFIRSIQAGTVNFAEILIYILVALMIIFLVMPFHEWAHAFTAYKLGDTSVKYRKRLTLNPLEHIDPMGALMIILLGFGWAKPVPINDRNFKNPKVGMGITALAGPVANLVAALVGGLIYNAIITFAPLSFLADGFGWYVLYFFALYMQLNITLAVFNLLPIPPLDGSKILFMFLPDKWVYTLYKYERYFFIAILALVWLDILPIGAASRALFNFVDWVTMLPFIAFG